MARTILLAFLVLPAILMNSVSGSCFHVDREDLLAYSCTGGHVADLNGIPEGVEQLQISRMQIPIITPHTFSRFRESLLVLKCSECEIEDIERNSFSHLPYLQQLSLDNNRLTSVRSSWLEGIKELTFLDLTYNQIEEIEDEAFEYLTGVTDLRLSGNRLKCLNIDALAHLENLNRIFLSENPDFQCPNAVTKYLTDRQVTLQKDDNWNAITQDLVPASGAGQKDWRNRRPGFYPTTTTPAYREKLTEARRHPTTESQWSIYLSSLETKPEWPANTESDVVRQDMVLNRGSSKYTSQYTPQTYTPPMERNWMTTQTQTPYWSSERTTEYLPRSRHMETNYPTYPTEDTSRTMEIPTETVYFGPKSGNQQSVFVPRVTYPQMVENYREFEETSTLSMPVKSETDKPLPDCPSSSSAISAAMQVLFLSVLLSASKIILVADGL